MGWKEQTGTCLQHSGPSGLPEGLVAILPDSEFRWKHWHSLGPGLEATEAGETHEKYKLIAHPWMQRKRLQAEEDNRAFKTLRRIWNETLWEIKTFKSRGGGGRD